MKKKFYKMHGLGNDFAIFDMRSAPYDIHEAQIRALADRRTGIGFDQMVRLLPGPYMDMYNADGSTLEACGNMTRCVARLLIEESGEDEITLKTVAGDLLCRRQGERGVEVDMGCPKLAWQDIPLAEDRQALSLPQWEQVQNFTAVNVGNPHAVFFVEDVDAIPLTDIGPQIETHPLFPQKINVEFVQVLDKATLRMRVWERGTGITRACGTGACAVAVAAALQGVSDRRVTVELDGGDLDIHWHTEDNCIRMTGDTVLVYEGVLRDR